ncbi:hypothetical protein [Kitasatospora sp. NPDC050543]|uniref:hypothetical protein n=1 Tax=Kitasatospora sp. NPDC050543 TaxID=3364054 RepID=UPI0037B343E0
MLGDPVRELMARHRALCEQAVDPLEIALGLEEAGLGPAAAARYRHADLFSLAEELYARVPRRPPEPAPVAPGDSWRRRLAQALRVALLVGPPCAVAAGIRLLGPGRAGFADLLAVLPVGLWLAVALAFAGAAARGGERGPAMLGYGCGVAAVLLLPSVVGAGPDTAVVAVAAALSIGAAEWVARWFRQAGQVHLRTSGTIAEFRARMRPVLPVALGLHLAVLALLTFAALAVLTAVAPRPGPAAGGLMHAAVERAGAVPWAAQAATGLLLALAVLLVHCGRARAAMAGAAGAVALTALLLAVRAMAGPVADALPLAGHGAEGARLLGSGAAGAVLLPYAWVVLGWPTSHR